MTTSTKTAMEALKGTKRESTTFGKVDVVVYPGVMLVNNVTYKLYKAAFESATGCRNATLERCFIEAAGLFYLSSIMSRAKWDCIRPGYLTLRQEFRLDNHWKGYLTGGNFSDDRQGLAAGIGYFSSDGRWTVEGEGGITGSSHLYGNDWGMSKWKRVEWTA